MNQKNLNSLRLLVFVEQKFRVSENTFSTDEPFVCFLDELGSEIKRLFYLGRLETKSELERYILGPKSAVWSIPNYRNLIDLTLRAPFILSKLALKLIQNREDWDVACICGPHLIGLMVALVCELLNRPYFFIVRENLPKMVRWRYTGFFRLVSLIQAKCLEKAFMRLGRFHPVLIVGNEVQRKYKDFGAQVKPLYVSLINKDQLWNDKNSKTKSPDEPFQLLTVSRLAPEKGLTISLKAIADLVSKGNNVHMNIVGEGSERHSLERTVLALGIKDNVTFTGYIPYGEPLLQLYRDADALIISSFSEGFPQVIIEAMANSLPIITTPVGGIPEVIVHEQNGLLVQPGSTSSLVSAINSLIENPNLRESLSKTGYKISKKYTKENQINSLLTCIKEIQD